MPAQNSFNPGENKKPSGISSFIIQFLIVAVAFFAIGFGWQAWRFFGFFSLEHSVYLLFIQMSSISSSLYIKA